MSTREALARARPKVHTLQIDDGLVIHLRALSGAGRAHYLQIAESVGEGRSPSIARIAALGICEQDGRLTYRFDNEEDVAELEQIDGALLNRIASKLFEISGLTAESVSAAEKKFDASQSD